jgi:hypothetical protein
MNVKIDEDEKHRITVEVLKEWHGLIEEHDLKSCCRSYIRIWNGI